MLRRYYEAQPETLPKSVRLYEACLKMVENCYWSPGDRIPSEVEMAQYLPVGLSTVQTALGRMASKGLIQRKRKAGSFICESAALGREMAYFLFMEEKSETFLPFLDRETRIFETREQGDWSNFVGLRSRYICIERLMEVAGEFRIHNRIYLGDPKFRPLLDLSATELKDLSFRILFWDRFGTPAMGSDRRVQFIRLDQDIATRLARAPGSPALLYEIRQFTLRDEPLFLMQTIIPENGRRLMISALSSS